MKKIISLLRLDSYVKTKKALFNIGVVSMNTQVVQGRGNKSVHSVVGNGEQQANIESNDPLYPKQYIDMVVEDDKVDEIIKIIIDTNKTGNSGDGKIFVLPVDDVLTIRTGEHKL